jgi:hypothetical protein
MTGTDCDHQEFTDPRGRGSCRKCGRVIPNPLTPERVEEFFGLLEEALQGAGKVALPPDESPELDHFKALAIHRLAQGAREYGNANFLKPTVDLAREMAEECSDIANYALMERVKHQPDEGDTVWLFQAAYHAFLAYQAMNRYALARRSA